jgi:hypothetical protein
MAGLTGNALAPGTETPSPRLFSPGGFSARGTREKRSALAAHGSVGDRCPAYRSSLVPLSTAFSKNFLKLRHGCPIAANLPISCYLIAPLAHLVRRTFGLLASPRKESSSRWGPGRYHCKHGKGKGAGEKEVKDTKAQGRTWPRP